MQMQAGVSAGVTSGCCIRCAGYYCTIVRWQRSAAGGSSPHPGGMIRILRIQTSDLDTGAGLLLADHPALHILAHFHPHLSNICLGVEYSWPECPCPSPASDSHHTSCCPADFPSLVSVWAGACDGSCVELQTGLREKSLTVLLQLGNI